MILVHHRAIELLPWLRDCRPHRTLFEYVNDHSRPKRWNIWERNVSYKYCIVCSTYLTTCRCFIMAARTKTSLRATWVKYQTKAAGQRVDSFIRVADVFVKTLTIVITARWYLLVPAVSFWFLLGDFHCIDYAIQSVAGLENPIRKVSSWT